MEMRAALEDITVNDLESFVEQFYNGMFVEGLVEGNLSFNVSLSLLFPSSDYFGMGIGGTSKQTNKTNKPMCPHQSGLNSLDIEIQDTFCVDMTGILRLF